MTWSLRQKVLASYGLLLLLIVTTVLWSVANLQRLGSAASAILRENYRSILAMDEMSAALGLQDRASLLALLGRVEEAQSEFSQQTGIFYQWYGREKDNITIPGEGEQADRLGGAYSAYHAGFSRLVAMEREDPVSAGVYYRGTLLALRNRVAEGIAGLKALNQTTMYAASRHAEQVASGAIFSVSFVGMVLLILGTTFSIVLSRIIVRPIIRLTEATTNVADGSYELQLEPTSSDELGTLTRSFNSMVRRIKSSSELKIADVVAEKQKSEAIVGSIEDGVVVLDEELRVVLANPAARQYLGIGAGYRDGQHFLEIINDPDLYEVVKESMSGTVTPTGSEEDEILEIEQDGKVHYYQIGINPIRGPGALTSGIVLLFRDVTRLKELERMKSEFVMMASHELKTPLTGIGMSIALLKENLDSTLSPKNRELLDAARDETARLKSLVNDLLELSRIEAGRIALEFQSVPPLAILEKARDSLRGQAEEKQIDIKLESVDDQTAVHADVTKTTWVVTNLIANALRHTPKGGWVKCSAVRRGEWMHFAVSDNGTGIAPEDQSRIFEKFVQAKGEQGGTGLGLAICKEIVRAGGGTIWVDSEPGKGSTFTFTVAVEHDRRREEHGS